MQIELNKPELQHFIEAQVRAGHFRSPEAAIEAAIEQMRLSLDQLDEQTIAAIAKADAQYEAGDYVEWHVVKDEMRKKYLGQ